MTSSTPEGIVKAQIKGILSLLRIKFWVHAASALSPRGVPDIVGTIPPFGKALYIECKAPGKTPSEEQERFLEQHREAGALAFYADHPQRVIDALALYGYEPAKRIKGMFPKQ